MLENFIYAKTKDLFTALLDAGNVLDEAIVFIEDTKEIWNHGTYFDGSKVDLSNIEEVVSKIKTDGDGNKYLNDKGEFTAPLIVVNSEEELAALDAPYGTIATVYIPEIIGESTLEQFASIIESEGISIKNFYVKSVEEGVLVGTSEAVTNSFKTTILGELFTVELDSLGKLINIKKWDSLSDLYVYYLVKNGVTINIFPSDLIINCSDFETATEQEIQLVETLAPYIHGLYYKQLLSIQYYLKGFHTWKNINLNKNVNIKSGEVYEVQLDLPDENYSLGFDNFAVFIQLALNINCINFVLDGIPAYYDLHSSTLCTIPVIVDSLVANRVPAEIDINSCKLTIDATNVETLRLLDFSGDGTKFLSNNGEYKELKTINGENIVGSGDITVVLPEAISDMETKTNAANTYQVKGDYITTTDAHNYTDTAIANLVDSAPDTLNTLNELANAITEHQGVTDALNAAIGNKLDKTEAASTYLTTLEQSLTEEQKTQVKENIGLTKTSQLLNDSNYMTSSAITDVLIVSALPESPESTTLYLITE